MERSGARGKMHMKRFVCLVLLWIAEISVIPLAFAVGDADETGDGIGGAVVLGEEDFAERLEILRNQYRRMTPGNGELVQDARAWPAAWEEFSPRWDTAPATRDLATWVVPIVAEREGWATVLRDGNGAELWRGTTDFAKEESTNVVLTGTLVSEEDWALWKAAREEISARLEAASPTGGRGGGYASGLRFTNAWADTNGDLCFDFAWETNGEVQVFCRAMHYEATTNTVVWTNDENEVVTNDVVDWHQVEGECFNGTPDTWELLGVATVTNGSGSFVDSGFAEEYGRVRFYAAAALADSDGDGLTDGEEWLVVHSDPTLADSDGDGLGDLQEHLGGTNPAEIDSDGDGIGDGLEVAAGFDPLDGEDRPKLTVNAVMNDPSGGGEAWMELYSASVRSIALGGVRLETGVDGVWSNAVTFGPGTVIASGTCLLVGESGVTNKDVEAVSGLGLPETWPTVPSAGIRLAWGNGAPEEMLDTVLIGGGNVTDPGALEATGWESSKGASPSAGSALVRWHPGADTDRRQDWTTEVGRAGRNSAVVIDTDGDGLTDGEEWTGSANTNALCSGEPTNPWNADSDGDGLTDSEECLLYGTNPNAWATDGDIYPWMPAGTVASNWPGSDSFEVASAFWNPTVEDQNTNGIPDSWEMAFASWGLDIEGDADGDGMGNLAEIRQNSNPRDAADSTAKPFVVRFESSLPEWENNGMCDVGMKGWVRMCFEGVREDVPAAVWVTEGAQTEPFAITCAALPVWNLEFTDSQHAIATLRLEAGTRPFLQVRDSGLWPNFGNTTGGEYLLDCIALEAVELVGAPRTGLVVLKGGDVTMKTSVYPASYVLPPGEPKWMYQRRMRGKSWDDWTAFSEDAQELTYTHATDLSGIFRVKAVLHLSESMSIERVFTREEDESNGLGKVGEPDAFGVADTQWQVEFSALARTWLGSTNYPYDGVVSADYGFPEYPANSYKCNIFVAHRAVEAGAVVPTISGFLNEYPPTANQWAGTEYTHSPIPWDLTYISHWVLEDSAYPQPGFVIAHPSSFGSGHVGVVDYDGIGIGAGYSGTVNKQFNKFYDGTSGFRRYEP